MNEPFEGNGIAVNSGNFDGLCTDACKKAIIEALEKSGAGKRRIEYKLRDWIFSRQRYWGEPIPIYFPVRTTGNPVEGDAYEIDFTHPIAVDVSELPLRLRNSKIIGLARIPPVCLLVRSIGDSFNVMDNGLRAKPARCRNGRIVLVLLRYLDPA
ncbi:MAG: class I tRNA ligase family protein [Polyangiales bacterium]